MCDAVHSQVIRKSLDGRMERLGTQRGAWQAGTSGDLWTGTGVGTATGRPEAGGGAPMLSSPRKRASTSVQRYTCFQHRSLERMHRQRCEWCVCRLPGEGAALPSPIL